MENTSGQGKQAVLPSELSGWSWNWGAFMMNWLWGIFNKTYIALLILVPIVGLVMPFVLGFKGNAWAWRNKRWDSLEHFRRVQRKWAIWGVIVLIVALVVAVVSVFLIFRTMKSSEPYIMAMDKVQVNSEAQKIIGPPIKSSFWTMGEVSVEGACGKAELAIPVQGSKQQGTVYVNATKEQNKWKLDKLVLLPEGGGAALDLLKAPQPPSVPVQQSAPVRPSKDTPPSNDKTVVQPRPTSSVAPVVVPPVAAPVQKPLQKTAKVPLTEKKTAVAESGPALKKPQAVSKPKKMYAKKTAGSGKTSTVSGRAKINAGDYKGAIKTLTAVIANNPDESINYRLRGNAYDNLEKRERAIEDWKKAAALGDTIIQSYLSFLGIEWE
jgi:heme/copper-type cytochrome/quinol oxidase subunit 2